MEWRSARRPKRSCLNATRVTAFFDCASHFTSGGSWSESIIPPRGVLGSRGSDILRRSCKTDFSRASYRKTSFCLRRAEVSAKKVVGLRDSRSQFIRSLTLYKAWNKVNVSLASKERSLGSVLAPNERRLMGWRNLVRVLGRWSARLLKVALPSMIWKNFRRWEYRCSCWIKSYSKPCAFWTSDSQSLNCLGAPIVADRPL